MAAPSKKYHYFVINQLGQSADRRGPFVSEEAALEWANTLCPFPAWVVPAVPSDKAKNHKVLDGKGIPITVEG